MRLVSSRASLGGLVRGVAFLPEEFRGPQEKARAHFPADDVCPLIDEDRQVAIGLHPLRVARADDRLAGRPHDERLGQFRRGRGPQAAPAIGLQAVMRDHRAFLGEALDVLRLLRQIGERE